MESYSAHNYTWYLVSSKLVLGVEINPLHALPHLILKTTIFAVRHFFSIPQTNWMLEGEMDCLKSPTQAIGKCRIWYQHCLTPKSVLWLQWPPVSQEAEVLDTFPTLLLNYHVTLNFSLLTWEMMGGNLFYYTAMLISFVNPIFNVSFL